MAGLKTIFDKNGTPLTDFRASAVRSYILNDTGEAVFMVATSGGICREDYLGFGNYVLLQHDTLPDWVGVIDTPRIWHHGYVEVHAYDITHLMKYSTAPLNTTIEGLPGDKFKRLLSYVNSHILIEGTITTGGVSYTETLTDDVLTHVLELGNKNGLDILFTPILNASGQLLIAADFRERVNQVTDLVLEQGFNVVYGDTPLEESGELINSVEGITDSTGEGTQTTFTYTEDASYGVREARVTFQGATAETLDTFVKDYVQKNKNPKASAPIEVVDVSNTFSKIRLGNVARYKFTNVGFDNTSANGLGASRYFRIEGFRLDESTGVCELMTGNVL